MEKFEFKLEKILGIREFEEKQAKIELGKAIAQSEKIKQSLEFIAQEKVKTNLLRSSSTEINDLLLIENYINGLEIKKEDFLIQLANAQIIVEEKREIYLKAMQKRKALEKLKEKKFENFNEEIELKNQTELDEINSHLKKN